MSPDLQSFSREVLCAQRLAALAAQAGESLSFETIVRLSAEAELIYTLANLEGRHLDLIEQHRALWQRACEFFDAAVSIWASVEADGELLRAHRSELEKLAEIARDRVQFYSIHDIDRRAYRLRKVG